MQVLRPQDVAQGRLGQKPGCVKKKQYEFVISLIVTS